MRIRRNRNGHESGAPLWMLDLMFLTAGALAWLLFYFILRTRVEGDSFVAPALLTAELPIAYVGEPYHVELARQGSCHTVTWHLDNAPEWLRLDPQQGILYSAKPADGTPTAVQDVLPPGQKAGKASLSIRISSECSIAEHRNDGTAKGIELEVRRREATPPRLTITTATLPDAIADRDYCVRLAAVGGYPFQDGDPAQYTWSVTQGGSRLGVYGLALDSSTGELKGKVERVPLGDAKDEKLTLTFQVADSEGNAAESKEIPLVIRAMADLYPLKIVAPSKNGVLPEGIAGSPYCLALSASGGELPYTWQTGGDDIARHGLVLNPETGVIEAAQLKLKDGNNIQEKCSFKAIVSDKRDKKAFVDLALTVTRMQQTRKVEILTRAFPVSVAGLNYEVALSARYGSPPYTWTVKNLPDGLACDPDKGVISGIPRAPGEYAVQIAVQDVAGDKKSSSGDMKLVVQEFTPVEELRILTEENLPKAVAGQSYDLVLSAKGGLGNYSWSLATIAPSQAGFTVTRNGHLRTDSANAGPGIQQVKLAVAVRDESNKTATANMTVLVVPTGIIPKQVKMVTDSLPKAIAGEKLRLALSATGGVSPYRWRLEQIDCKEEIRKCVTLLESGFLEVNVPKREEGRPPEKVKLTVAVSDETTGWGDSKDFEFIILPGKDDPPKPEICEGTPPEPIVNREYRLHVPVRGGVAPYVWELQGTLPGGLAFDDRNGTIHGIATQTGNSEFRILATDMKGDTAAANLRLDVLAEPGFPPPPPLMELFSSAWLFLIVSGIHTAIKEPLRTIFLIPKSSKEESLRKGRFMARKLLATTVIGITLSTLLIHFYVRPKFGGTAWYNWMMMAVFVAAFIDVGYRLDRFLMWFKGKCGRLDDL